MRVLPEVGMTQEEELRMAYRRIPTPPLLKKLEQERLPALTRQIIREVLHERGKLVETA